MLQVFPPDESPCATSARRLYFEVPVMSAPGYANRKQVKSIEWLFTQLPGESSGSGVFQIPPVVKPPDGSIAQAGSLYQPAAAESPAYTGPSLPPLLENPADLRAAYEWLQTEKNRLEEYTR